MKGALWWAQCVGGDVHHNIIEQIGSQGARGWGIHFRYGGVGQEQCGNNNVHENLIRYDVPESAVSEREVISVLGGAAGWGASPSSNSQVSFGFLDMNTYELSNTTEEIFNVPSQFAPTRSFAEMQAAGYELNGSVGLL
jgi:hypothetical protein